MQRYGLPVVLIIVAAVLQGNLPGWLIFKGARPDFVLVVLVASGLTLEPIAGSLIGFFAGICHGSIVGYSLGSFVVSRTIIGFAASSMITRMFSENPVVPVLAAGGLTFFGEALFLLANPGPDFGALLNTILLKSLYNSLLTIMIFWLLRFVQVRRKIKMATARL